VARHQACAFEPLRRLVAGEDEIDRRRHGHRPRGFSRDGAAPGDLPAFRDRGRQRRDLRKRRIAPHQRAEHAMHQPARAAIHQRQDSGDRRMVRRRHGERLDHSDAQREAGLGVVRKPLGGGGVDQRVEVGQAAQRFRRDRVSEGLVVRPLEVPRRNVQRRLQRQSLAQNRVEQAKCGAA
jgi:hypothetical protein